MLGTSAGQLREEEGGNPVKESDSKGIWYLRSNLEKAAWFLAGAGRSRQAL